MKIHVHDTTADTAADAAAALRRAILTAAARDGTPARWPDFVALHFNSDYVADVLREGLMRDGDQADDRACDDGGDDSQHAAPREAPHGGSAPGDTPTAGAPAEAPPRATSPGALHGASSCRGVMSGRGALTEAAVSAGAFCIDDPLGDYGTALCAISADCPAAQAAASALNRALVAAGRVGEAPDLIWLSPTPGQEEQVLAGIESVVGPGVPVVGGSAADNTVAGGWQIFDAAQCATEGVLVSVLFPSGTISLAYQNGYAPAGPRGVATQVEGRRLVRIDDRPAAQVYDEWSGVGILNDGASAQSNILAASTLRPLGRPVAADDRSDTYLLAHPSTVHPDGAIELFADVHEGEVLVQMQGDLDGLASRAGRVADLARTAADLRPQDIAGALMVYCGGCMLATQDRMDSVVSGIAVALPQVPFLGIFTFGEQGNIMGVGNRHGNLMISCVLFSK
ncbi:FIST signal transduction protein [Brevirhabdus sp.]|uniref:FIST signal transduction protein n=1 Tax=Brevirhabdus sp. TaxID=2004514 RepID=UPI00405807C7